MSSTNMPPRHNANLVLLVIGGTLGIALIITALMLVQGRSAEQNTDVTTVVESNVIEPPKPLQDFAFMANNGETLNLSDLRGRYVLVAFGYTRCPDVCPTNLLDFRQIKRGLGDNAERVAFVFISVDGERDTPQLLDAYVKRYDADFIGLSGLEPELSRIADDYGLFYSRRENVDSDAGYMVDHTASRYLIDPEGRLIRIYSFTTPPRTILNDIRRQL